jgi:hypothetical protein
MASIPGMQSQSNLMQAQAAQARAEAASLQQQTNFNLWAQNYALNMKNTPAGASGNSDWGSEPSLNSPDAVASGGTSAGTAATSAAAPTTAPNALISNVPYAAGNAGATGTPSSGAPAGTPANVAPSSAGSSGAPAGSTPVSAPLPTHGPNGATNLDDGTGGFFNDHQMYNAMHAKYQPIVADPQTSFAMGLIGKGPAYAASIAAQNDQRIKSAWDEVHLLENAHTAPPGSVANAFDQAFGSTANPHPSAAAVAAGATEDNLKAQMWKRANAILVSGQILPGKQDLGDKILYTDPNGQPAFGMGTLTKGVEPDSAQTAATTQRGQDITAATAARGQNIGALDVQKDSAGNPFIVDKRTGALVSPAPRSANTLISGSPGVTPPTNNLIGPVATAPASPSSVPPGASGPGATPTASATIVPKMLPGVDLTQLPQAAAPAGGFQNAVKAADSMAATTRKNAMISSAAADVQKSAADNSLLSQEQSKLNSINPRAVGPASPAYKAMMELQTAVTGKAPNDLVDMGIVTKLSAQLGMQNAQQLLKGMRITNNEMMTVLNLASANPNQPLGVMKAIIGFQKANNEYTGLAGQTTVRGIKGGADPDQIAGGIEAQSPRSAYVANRVTEMVNPAPKGALALLTQNPYLAAKFQAKYGYMPTGQQ